MSATTSAATDEEPSTDGRSNDAASDSAESKEERLRAFLSEKANAEGELYVKSKFIADEVGLSAKEIGALMVKLKDSATDISIEKWSYTSATTWRIEPA